MTNDTPAPDAPPPIPHRAPPLDTRPRSRLAVWALATSILLAIVGSVLGMIWIAAIPGVVLGLVAVLKIPARTMRGQGMAIAALLVALLTGSCQFIFARGGHEVASQMGRGVLVALASEEPQTLDAWLTPEAKDKGLADKIRARYAAVVAEMGPYQQAIDSGSLLLGVLPVAMPPPGATEIVPEGSAEASPHAGGLWIRATFERGTVHVELLPGEDTTDAMAGFVENPGSPARVLRDVHFYKQGS